MNASYFQILVYPNKRSLSICEYKDILSVIFFRVHVSKVLLITDRAMLFKHRPVPEIPTGKFLSSVLAIPSAYDDKQRNWCWLCVHQREEQRRFLDIYQNLKSSFYLFPFIWYHFMKRISLFKFLKELFPLRI